MRPGDLIDGKYRIELPLGEGGMGTVYAAQHEELGSTVAIKILRTEALSSPEVPRRFLREARAAAQLRSDHIVRVTDVGKLASGEPYMVMEMLHGHDLATRLKAGPVPPQQAIDYIVQACEGLAEAHGRGMVHRDIKPANLFVTARPNGSALVKLLDFGIATAQTGELNPRLTTTQSVMGSPSYMSPEQLKGARDVDARSDIWSLGVTLYELLSDRQPFVGPTLTALSLAIVTEPHPPLHEVAPELAAIVDRCLQKDPADRYASVAELTRALAPMFTGGHTAAEMVAGSYKMPVPPTLLSIEDQLPQLRGGSGPAIARPPTGPVITSPPMAVVPISPSSASRGLAMTSTTSLASGETGALPAVGGNKRWLWAIAAVATIALGIGVGVVAGGSNRKDAAADNTVAAHGTDPAKTDPAKTDPAKTDPAKTDPAKTDPAKTDPATTDPTRTDPAKTDPAKTDPAKTDPAKTDPAKTDPAKTDPAQPVVKTEPDPPKKTVPVKRQPPKIIKQPPKKDPDPPKKDPDPPKKDPDPPKKDPDVKKPCPPNDIRCGL